MHPRTIISLVSAMWLRLKCGEVIVILVELLMPPLTSGTVQYTVRFLGPELTVIFSGYRSSGGFGTVWVCQGGRWIGGRGEERGGEGRGGEGRGEERRGEERRGEERRGEERRGEERRGEERRGEERRGEERRGEERRGEERRGEERRDKSASH